MPPTGGGPPSTPFPFKDTVTVASSRSLEGISSVADLVPVEVGLNTTLRVAELPWAIVASEQLSFWIVNWSAFVPARLIVPTTRSAVPTLLTVNVCDLDESTVTLPKFFEVGLTEMSGSGAALICKVTGTVCGVLVAQVASMVIVAL